MIIYQYTPMIKLPEMTYPVYLRDFYAANPQISPNVWTYEENMSPFDYYPVRDVTLPIGEVLIEGTPELKDDGLWYKTWTTRDFTPEEIVANLFRAKDDHKIFADTLLNSEIYREEGIPVRDKFFKAYPVEYYNYLALEKFVEDSDETIFTVVDASRQPISGDKETILGWLKDIQKSLGLIQHRYNKYVAAVEVAEDIPSIPPIPTTFVD